MKTARQAMLAKVHLAKRDLALSDADYRHVLSVQFGTDSAAKLNDKELHRLLDHFRSKGWPPRGDRRPQVPAFRAELIDKIEAQLSELANYKGKRVPWSYAESILRRQTGNPHAYLNWAKSDELTKIIQSLYYALERESIRESAAQYAREIDAKAPPEYRAHYSPDLLSALARVRKRQATRQDHNLILGALIYLQGMAG
jgi:phage gp16-like protein